MLFSLIKYTIHVQFNNWHYIKSKLKSRNITLVLLQTIEGS